MAKTTTFFDLVVSDRPQGIAVFKWLYKELRSAILDGRLKRGMRLPSTRGLAQLYGISRGTVVTAFEQLCSEGYVEAHVGAGTFVNILLPEDLLQVKQNSSRVSKPKKVPSSLSQYAQRLAGAPAARTQPFHAFRATESALDAFPLTLWTQMTSRRLRGATRALLADVDIKGYLPLREAIASYLGSARGVRCSTDQVIIVAGVQQGLDLTARLVLDSGDPVWLEDPCFVGVTAVFEALAAKIIPVAVRKNGLDVAEARRRCDRAKLAYVTPAHQFLLGVTMSADQRLALLDWARRTGGLIFEDDYDSECCYSGRPVPALQGLDQSDSVIFSGSFSKVLFPGLHLGYLVVPEPLVDKFAAARFAMDGQSSVIDQAVLCDFITEGHFSRHIRRIRELYASRLAVLREAVQRRLAGRLHIPKIEAGVNAVGWLQSGIKAEAVAKMAADHKVEVVPIRRFAVNACIPEGLFLGFGAVNEREILRGVDCLASVIEKCGRKPHSAALYPGSQARSARYPSAPGILSRSGPTV